MNTLVTLQLAFWAPLAGAMLIVATGRHAAVRDGVTLATALTLFGALLLLAVFGLDAAYGSVLLLVVLTSMMMTLLGLERAPERLWPAG